MANFQNPPTSGVLSLAPGDTAFVFGIPNTAAALATTANGGAARAGNVVTFTTLAAHNYVVGMPLVVKGTGSTNGTRFDGNYIILTVPTTTTLTAQPVDSGIQGNMNQPNDTGGGGNLFSIAAEQPAAPQASIALALADRDAHINDNLSIEIFFTGAPGAFEVDLQESDTYNDGAFVFPAASSNKITAVNASNVGRIDIDGIIAKFVRINLVSRANAVGIVARLSR